MIHPRFKWKVVGGCFLCCLGLFGSRGSSKQNPSRQPAGAAITINAASPAKYQIPRTIFGSFLEPIGNSIYGGLWAELLRNPSFEANLWSAEAIRKMISDDPDLLRSSQLGLPLPWEPLDPQQGARYEPRWNDAANSYRSLFLMGLPEKEVGVRQEVYLPAHRTLDYRGSVYVKHVSGPGELEVSLRSRKDSRNTLARRQLDLSGDGWKRYDFEFRIPDGEAVTLEPLDFVVSVKNETRVLIDQASLVPGDAIEGMDPEMIAMAKAIKSPIIRYGGNFTSAYHWRDGIGPPDKRISMLNVAWGMPEYNTFGTDEFLRFCELLGARPQIALNLGSGNPGEASQWVKYVNERWGDHSGGLLWELGNELWGSFQVGYPTRQRVGDRTQAFSGAVRTVDPRAKLIATGGDEDSYQEWNAAQLTNAGSFDYLSTHFVVTTDKVVRSNPSPDFISSSAFALPVGLERKLREMDRQIQSNPTARGKVKIAFTEWLFWASQDTAPRYDNMGGAICTAGFLNMLLRVADIVPVADMTGIIEFGGIWKKRGRVFGTPAYWAFRMYSKADATVPVEVSTRSAQYNVEQGSTRLPNIPDVPYLDTVALVNERRDKLTLFCVNRNLARDLPTAISIAGFAVDPQVAVQTLYASTIYAKNDEAHPDAVIPHRETARFDGETLHYTFRHESITVMEFRKKT